MPSSTAVCWRKKNFRALKKETHAQYVRDTKCLSCQTSLAGATFITVESTNAANQTTMARKFEPISEGPAVVVAATADDDVTTRVYSLSTAALMNYLNGTGVAI